nr:MBL fold metallo-hydrolase [bacterium]
MILVRRYDSMDASENGYAIICNSTRKTAVIDPSMDVERMLAQLSDMKAKVEAILLTHGHFDHIASVQKLKEKTGAPVYIHRLDAPLLEDAALNASTLTGHPFTVGAADVLLEDGQHLTVGQMDISVTHIGQHSPGSSVYSVGNAYFVGDAVFANGIGRTDLPGGGSMYGLMEAIQGKLLTAPADSFFFPGHGMMTSPRAILQYNPFFGSC